MRNIQKTVYKVSDFLSWQRAGSLELSPAFQRRPVWPVGAKSFLIDTIVRGIPMPIIFLRQKTNAKTLEPLREVVDGQQRLRTVFSFVHPKALPDFDPRIDSFTVAKAHNPEISGRLFEDLPANIRQGILDYDFSVHVLPADTEDRDLLQIFARMNSTGLKLNEQEIRNAEFFGVFKDAMYQLAYEQLERWRRWGVFTETDIARMKEVEETSDIVITMLFGVHGKKQKQISQIYRKYEENFPSRAEVVRRFRTVMDIIVAHHDQMMRESAFRRKPLFHTLFTFYYDASYGLGSSMSRMRAQVVPAEAAGAVTAASDRIISSKVPEQLSKVLRGATNHLPARKARLKFLTDTLNRAERNR